MLMGWKWILVYHIWLMCMWEYRLTPPKTNSKQVKGILPSGPTPPPQGKFPNKKQNFTPPAGKISVVFTFIFILKAPLSVQCHKKCDIIVAVSRRECQSYISIQIQQHTRYRAKREEHTMLNFHFSLSCFLFFK